MLPALKRAIEQIELVEKPHGRESVTESRAESRRSFGSIASSYLRGGSDDRRLWLVSGARCRAAVQALDGYGLTGIRQVVTQKDLLGMGLGMEWPRGKRPLSGGGGERQGSGRGGGVGWPPQHVTSRQVMQGVGADPPASCRVSPARE